MNKIQRYSNMDLLGKFKKSIYYNPFIGCPAGYRKQTGYTRKSGKRFPTRCVHTASASASAKARKTKKWLGGGVFSNLLKSSSRKCPKGYVYRKGYTRKFRKTTRRIGYTVRRKDGRAYKIFPKTKSATVKSTCAKPRGKGHAKRSATSAVSSANSALSRKCAQLKKGEMARYNYQYRQPATTRRLAIKRAIQDSSPVTVQKRLALASKCSAAINPTASRVFKEDADFIRKTYAIESLL
jgi:hypothetical protein